jgi:hypothetical protein
MALPMTSAGHFEGREMDDKPGSANGYRKRAEHLRAEAKAIASVGTKQALLDIAGDYDRLASSIDANARRRISN